MRHSGSLSLCACWGRHAKWIVFENEIHETIIKNNLFTRGETIAIGASGGKDSTVLAHIHLKFDPYFVLLRMSTPLAVLGILPASTEIDDVTFRSDRVLDNLFSLLFLQRIFDMKTWVKKYCDNIFE